MFPATRSMASTLTALLPPTRSGRSLFLASSFLGFCALIQFVMLVWYLLHGVRPSAQPVLPIIQFAETTQPTVPTVESPLQPAPYRAAPAPGTVGAAADGGPVYPLLVRPTPAPASRLPAESNDLLEQARQLRQHGDTNAALGRLREAQVAEPDNPLIVAEMAVTYENMQLPDKAAEQWQRLYGMGESVGALYYLADSKLHAAPVAAAPATDGGGNALADAAAGRAGFQNNAVLKITDIDLEEVADPAAEKKLALKIVVKNRPGIVIDPNKVKIETYFYDLVDGRDILQTDAQTDYAWLTPAPINWANDKSEVLEAIYLRVKGGGEAVPESPRATPRRAARGPKGRGSAGEEPAAAATPATDTPVRAYLGYTVRLYYDRQLQDVKADPVRLLQQFTVPMTLPVEQR